MECSQYQIETPWAGWLYARIFSLSTEYEFRPHPFFTGSTRKENLVAAGTDSPSRLHAASEIASPSNKVEHRSSNVLNNRLNIQYCSKYCSHLQQHYEHQRIRLSLATTDRKKGKLINSDTCNGPQIFQKSSSRLPILGARTMT